MKQFLSLLIGLLFSVTVFAQNNAINYKVLIKDNLGNVIANQSVTTQFSILKGALLTLQYREVHTKITDANGILILNIGEGTQINGTYNNITWESDDHFLNVQVNTGSNLVDMGTTQFMAVPYAISAGNVSGLEAIDEGNGIGWRLKNRDPDKSADIGIGAIDFSISNSNSETKGAAGAYSFAVGTGTEASGVYSMAIGFGNRATGQNSTSIGFGTLALGDFSTAIGGNNIAASDNSTAMGGFTEASGLYATAMGGSTKASGNISSALGRYTIAEAFASTSIGSYNIGGGTADDWVLTDPLFEIGNSDSSSNRSNALTILKNGTITAPSFDIEEITDDKALITKEYFETNVVSFIPSGLEKINEGSGTGWRLKGQNPDDYGDIGAQALDFSFSPFASNVNGATGPVSFASGDRTTASGNTSTAMGRSTIASASFSTAMGRNSNASGEYSTAMGRDSNASGDYSTSMGFNTNGDGDYSIAMGQNTKAEAYTSIAVGRYNIGGGSPSSWQNTDPLFEVGNGTLPANLSNALTVLKNGKVGIGEHQPSGYLEVKAQNSGSQPNINLIHEGTTGARINFSNTETTNGNVWTFYGDTNNTDANSIFNLFHTNTGNILQIRGDGQVGINGSPNTDLHLYHGNNGATSGMKLQNSSDNSWWRLYVSSGSDDLRLYSASQGTTIIGAFNDVSGAYTSSSDRRLKKNFNDLYFDWENFMKLETLTYQYKAQENNRRHIGLIAQDVAPIYPELVNYNKDEDVYHLNYSGFGVVAIKAVQELKKEVNTLKKENAELKDKLNAFEQLEARLTALENNAIDSNTVSKINSKD